MRPALPPGFLVTLRLVAAFLAAFCAVRAATGAAPRMLLLDGATTGGAIVVVGERGTILRSTDQAVTWRRADAPTRATLTGISFSPASSTPAPPGWAVGHDAVILASTDGGLAWTRQHQGGDLQDSFLDVLAVDERRVIAIGAYGLYCSTDDGGRTWTRRRIRDEDAHLNRIARGPGGTLYIAGEAGTLLRSEDSGGTWKTIPTPYTGSFHGIIALDRRTLIAHGLTGHILRSADDGATWQSITSPRPVLLAAGLQLRSNHLLLAGHAGTLLVSRDYGKTFTTAATPPPSAVAELLELPGRGFLALGEAGATVHPLP